MNPDPRFAAAWRALCECPGFGPRRLRFFLDAHPTPPRLDPARIAPIAEGLRLDPETLRRSLAPSALARARAANARDRERGIALLHPWGGIPAALTQIPDPPKLLFRRGAALGQDRLRVAIVGSRAATYYGLAMAETLATQLSERGVAVVSGLARGIDAAAHRATVRTGGLGIAVLGHGLQTIYPPQNASIARDLTRKGALLTELPWGLGVRRDHFPRRNRLIAGLCHAVVVVEAGLRSGALITARLALEYGREVLAVPGPADAPSSRGPNALIRDGAALVEHADDILDALAFTGFAPQTQAPNRAPSTRDSVIMSPGPP